MVRFAILLLFLLPSAAVAKVEPCLDFRLTVQLRDTPLPSLLDTLSEASGCNFVGTPAAERERLTIAMANVPVTTLLRAIEQRFGLVLIREGNVHFMTRRGEEIGLHHGFSGRLVSLDLHQANLRAVLETLLKLSGQKFTVSVSGELQTTLKLGQVPWDQAFDILLQRYNLVMTPVSDGLYISAP